MIEVVPPGYLAWTWPSYQWPTGSSRNPNFGTSTGKGTPQSAAAGFCGFWRVIVWLIRRQIADGAQAHGGFISPAWKLGWFGAILDRQLT